MKIAFSILICIAVSFVAQGQIRDDTMAATTSFIPVFVSLPTFGQIRYDTATVISNSDPIYAVLAADRTAIEKGHEDGKMIRATFRPWVAVDSAPAARLFPGLRFASIAWSESPHPEAKYHPVGLALSIEKTVAIDTNSNRIVMGLFCEGNYEPYGKLLVAHNVSLRNTADAKTIWEAFCDIHHRHWKDFPLEKVSDVEWHLGLSSHAETMSVIDGFKTEATRTYYMKVVVDPKTGLIVSCESKVDTSEQRKTPVP